MKLSEEFPQIENVRGKGGYQAFDSTVREDIQMKLREKGVHIGLCGAHSVRVRSSLILTREEVAIFIGKFREVLKTL